MPAKRFKHTGNWLATKGQLPFWQGLGKGAARYRVGKIMLVQLFFGRLERPAKLD